MEESRFLSIAEEISGSRWDAELEAILKIGFENDLIFKNAAESSSLYGNESLLIPKLRRKIVKYFNAKDARVNSRISNPGGTLPDPAIEGAIKTRLPNLTDSDLKAISDAHKLAMSAENIVGPLLEEYLAQKLQPLGIINCWGSIIRAVDFIKLDGSLLLQVKNSDNSENSSSSSVRTGTTIQKWFRRYSRRAVFNWENLNILLGLPEAQKLSEEGFQAFIVEVIRQNPAAIHVDRGNEWNT